MQLEKATFGAGCFWQVGAAYRSLPGVVNTSVGYMGGHFANPCHLDVVARITGHAEVAQVEYDPAMISYSDLLAKFWAIHDPTSLNRQGPDRGEQYRSVIFYHTPSQHQVAWLAKLKLDASGHYETPIVTQIQSATDYWLAAAEHQQYCQKNKPKPQGRSNSAGCRSYPAAFPAQ